MRRDVPYVKKTTALPTPYVALPHSRTASRPSLAQWRASNVPIWRLLLLFSSPFCSLSQHCEGSERRVLLQRRFNKSTTFWWLCCSISYVCGYALSNVSVCVCLRISSLLSFSLCINVRAWFSDLLWHAQTAFKGRMKAVDRNVVYSHF